MCGPEKWIKLAGTVLCEIFAAYTVIMLLAGHEPDRLALAFGTLLLVLLPMLLEKLFRCRICLPVYIFALAYAIGPMLGHCWKLYYTVPVWDKLLHICGGVMFAILGALKGWKIAFVSKPEDLKVPFFGRIIRRCCFLPIDREDPRKAIVTINKAANLLKGQEVSVGIYPEGTRSKTGQLLPFHNGVFKIAQKAGTPIVVLSITGTEKICTRTPFQPTDVYLDVLDIFPGEDIKGIKTETIGRMARHLIVTNTEKRDAAWQKDM